LYPLSLQDIKGQPITFEDNKPTIRLKVDTGSNIIEIASALKAGSHKAYFDLSAAQLPVGDWVAHIFAVDKATPTVDLKHLQEGRIKVQEAV